MKDLRNKIIIICGATATGKSALAVAIAKLIDAEVVSADSMQIYKGLDVGTAKITQQEMQGVPHHLLNIIEPDVHFSVADYVKLARPIIDDIFNRDKKVIICGGTGLYIDAVCDGREFLENDLQPEIINMLNNTNTTQLYDRLKVLDNVSAERIHPNNRKRLIRALYITLTHGKPFSQVGEEALPSKPPFNRLVFHCNYPDRQLLYSAIEGRVDSMLRSGLLKEAQHVYNNRLEFTTAAAAIGYKEFFPYIEGDSCQDECIVKLKQATRNYAKRQLSWFNRYSDANIIDVTKQDTFKTIVLPLLKEFYS